MVTHFSTNNHSHRTESGHGGGGIHTLFPTGTPSFSHSTVGSGVPEMPSWMSRGSPARTRISLAPNRLSRFSLGLSAKSRSISFTTYYYLNPLPTRPATHKPISPPTSPVIHSSTEPFTCLLSHLSTHKPCSHPQTYLAIHKLIDSVTHKAIHLPTISLLYPQTLQPPTNLSSHPQAHWFSHTQSHSSAYYLTSLPTNPAATHKPI